MSKIKVDIIEDSSGNAIRFPSTPLADGYLKVSSNGTLTSAATLPTKTEFITIYDADTSGSSASTDIIKSLTTEQVNKILSGARCLMIHSNVMGIAGWNFRNANGGGSNSGYRLNKRYNSANGQGFTSSESGQYVYSQNNGYSTLITEMIGGIDITEFQVSKNSANYFLHYISTGTVNNSNQNRKTFNRVVTTIGGLFLNHTDADPLTEIYFLQPTVCHGGGIVLAILGDD